MKVEGCCEVQQMEIPTESIGILEEKKKGPRFYLEDVDSILLRTFSKDNNLR